jgi:hypothetical protein
MSPVSSARSACFKRPFAMAAAMTGFDRFSGPVDRAVLAL